MPFPSVLFLLELHSSQILLLLPKFFVIFNGIYFKNLVCFKCFILNVTFFFFFPISLLFQNRIFISFSSSQLHFHLCSYTHPVCSAELKYCWLAPISYPQSWLVDLFTFDFFFFSQKQILHTVSDRSLNTMKIINKGDFTQS